MLQELIYTSAPVGLKPGSQGFCTVACTTGTPQNVVKLLETLSGYRHVFPPPDPNAGQNPIASSHLLLSLGGVPWHILSRTADAGLDFAQQKNSISHHLVLDKAELQNAGPAAILSQYPFLTAWNRKPVILPVSKKLPAISSQPRVCEQWAKLTGDAGWGGILAETALTKRPVSIIFRPGMAMLPLVDEALALLPPEVRWQVSFSTYCCNLPNGTGCQWKGILTGSPEMSQAKSTATTLVIDLTQTLGLPPAGQLVEAARTGKPPEKREIPVIPLAIRESEQAVYGTKVAETSPLVTTPASVPASQVPQTPVKPKPAKDKKNNSDDVASKGCFWLIILFFILVTAGLFGGIFWYFGKDITHQGNASTLEKTIRNLEVERDQFKLQSEGDQAKMNQLAAENANWRETRSEYEQLLRDKDKYINDVAGYFSLFRQMSLSPVTVNVKNGIPRKEGEWSDLLDFNGTLARQTWEKDIRNVFSVNVTCSVDDLDCLLLEGAPVTNTSGNVLLSYPFRLYARKEDGSWVLIAEFDLIVTESGISVRAWNDNAWSKLVEDELKTISIPENQDAFGLSRGLIDWYEANVKDKTFVLDEDMLKRMDELGVDVLTGGNADVAKLIELRKSFFQGDVSLQFLFDVNSGPLTEKVKRDNPGSP